MPRKSKHECSISRCKNLRGETEYCDEHYLILKQYGTPPPKPKKIHRRKTSNGYIEVNSKLEHVLIAEKALGKPMPKGAQAHHANRVKDDNRPTNLVICPDDAYHRLIEMRTLAYEATGHADWRKCVLCKKYDNPKNMFIDKQSTALHRECRRIAENNRYHTKRSAEALEACGNPNYRKCPYCDKWDDQKNLDNHGHHPECFSATLTKSWTDERKAKTRTVKVTIEGIEYFVADLEAKYEIKRDTILARAKRGLPFVKVIAKI